MLPIMQCLSHVMAQILRFMKLCSLKFFEWIENDLQRMYDFVQRIHPVWSLLEQTDPAEVVTFVLGVHVPPMQTYWCIFGTLFECEQNK